MLQNFLFQSSPREPLLTYPREELKRVAFRRQFDEWSVSTTSQCKYAHQHPTLIDDIRRTSFRYRHRPHFSAILCNRFPTPRLLRHTITEFSRDTRCVLCHLDIGECVVPHHLVCGQVSDHVTYLLHTFESSFRDHSTVSYASHPSTTSIPDLIVTVTRLLTRGLPFLFVPFVSRQDLPDRLYGSAATRSPTQMTCLRAHAFRLIDSLRSDTILAFTDGSWNPTTTDRVVGSACVISHPQLPTTFECSTRYQSSSILDGELLGVILAADVLSHQRFDSTSVDRVCILTDSRDSQRLLLGIDPLHHQPLATLAFHRLQELRRRFEVDVLWIGSKCDVAGAQRAHDLATAALRSKDVQPLSSVPPSGFFACRPGRPLSLPRSFPPGSSSSFPGLSRDLSLLIARLHAEFCVHTSKCYDIVSDHLSSFTNPTPPSLPTFGNVDRLVHALRTPFLVTDDLVRLPHNTIGWQHPRQTVDHPHIGTFDLFSPISVLHLYLPTPNDLRQIKRLCLRHSRHSTQNPWRHVFILPSSQTTRFLRFSSSSPTNYVRVCTFTSNDETYSLFLSHNHLSEVVDPIHVPSLRKWLSQFPTSSISYTTTTTRHVRRSLRRFVDFLPSAPLTFAQPYFHHLNLRAYPTTLPDPSLLLCGVLLPSKPCPSTLQHNHSFLQRTYHQCCSKYRSIKSILTTTPTTDGEVTPTT